MRYVAKADKAKVRRVDSVGNISVTGSVRGMQQLYGWPKGGHARIGQWVYHVGTAAVKRLRGLGILRGEG